MKIVTASANEEGCKLSSLISNKKDQLQDLQVPNLQNIAFFGQFDLYMFFLENTFKF